MLRAYVVVLSDVNELTLHYSIEEDEEGPCHRLLVAASDEQNNAVSLWDGGSGGVARLLAPHDTPPMDMLPFMEGGSQFIASISEHQLLIHKLGCPDIVIM